MGIRVRYTGGFSKRKRAVDVEAPREGGVLSFTKGETVDLAATAAIELLRTRPEDFERVYPGADGYADAEHLSAQPEQVASPAPEPPKVLSRPLPRLPVDELVPGEILRVSREDADALLAQRPGTFERIGNI